MPKHVFANPTNPLVCPVLSLAVYIFCLGPHGQRTVLFGSGDPEARFSKWLHLICKEYEHFLRDEHGVKIGDLGTHSIRKGVTTYLQGLQNGPSNVAIWLRAGWYVVKFPLPMHPCIPSYASMHMYMRTCAFMCVRACVHIHARTCMCSDIHACTATNRSLGVQNRYILGGGGADHLCGRAAAMLDLNHVTKEFCNFCIAVFFFTSHSHHMHMPSCPTHRNICIQSPPMMIGGVCLVTTPLQARLGRAHIGRVARNFARICSLSRVFSSSGTVPACLGSVPSQVAQGEPPSEPPALLFACLDDAKIQCAYVACAFGPPQERPNRPQRHRFDSSARLGSLLQQKLIWT